MSNLMGLYQDLTISPVHRIGNLCLFSGITKVGSPTDQENVGPGGTMYEWSGGQACMPEIAK